ncbi:MAG: retropepsin-like aspartic protease [Nitrososphaerales archaeon]
MKIEQATADVEVRYREKIFELKCLVDTGASKSVISKRLADKLGAFIPFEEPQKPYTIRTADREGKLRLIGYCRLAVRFQNVEVPGGAVFEVAENLREDLDLVIGRPEIDTWGIIFTPEGPRPKKVPIEFEII